MLVALGLPGATRLALKPACQRSLANKAWSMSGRRRWVGTETLRGIGTEARPGTGAPIVGYSRTLARLVPRLSGIQLVAASDDSITARCNRNRFSNNFLQPARRHVLALQGKKLVCPVLGRPVWRGG